MLKVEVNRKQIRDRYNGVKEIWRGSWHSITGKRITQLVQAFIAEIKDDLSSTLLLNAGSAGQSYGLKLENQIHIDITPSTLNSSDPGVCGNIEAMPFIANSFGICLCVGSVLNYCNAIDALNEIDRVLYTGAYLLLEFERSESSEYLWQPGHGHAANIVSPSYDGSPETIWVYSECFILDVLDKMGYEVIKTRRFHILSPLALRLFKNESVASRFACLDPLLSLSKTISKGATNFILLCQKKT